MNDQIFEFLKQNGASSFEEITAGTGLDNETAGTALYEMVIGNILLQRMFDGGSTKKYFIDPAYTGA